MGQPTLLSGSARVRMYDTLVFLKRSFMYIHWYYCVLHSIPLMNFTESLYVISSSRIYFQFYDVYLWDIPRCVACWFYVFLAATKQLYKWYFPSVCLSVCLSVRLSVTPFSPCSHHRIIMKFSGVITMVKSDVHAKGQGQRSKVKVTEVNTQLSRFRTLTPVWIHIWQWNHAHSWKQPRRGALLFFKVIRQISRSHGSKNRRIWPRLGVSWL